MQFHDEEADYTGAEIFVIYASDSYYVTFQVAEGIPKPPVLLKASVEGDTIEFQLPKGHHPEGKFVGKFTDKELIGKIEGKSINFRLKRKNSIWQ